MDHGQHTTIVSFVWGIADDVPRDAEQIPLLEPGGIAGFIEREVLPHAPDAWVDEDSIRIGYEISFTRYS